MPGLFDKMKAGITEKAMEATIRSKEAIDAQQIKGKINDLDNQKNKALAELGQTVHAMVLGDSLDQAVLSSRSASISAIEAQIKDRERELAELHSAADRQVAELKS